MIAKEANFHDAADLVELALDTAVREESHRDEFSLLRSALEGRAAMAALLETSYGKRRTPIVLNNIQLILGLDPIAIDHLILTPTFAVAIDAHTMTQDVSVDRHMNWSRPVGGQAVAIPSPMEAAEAVSRDLSAIFKTLVRRIAPSASDANRSEFVANYTCHSFAAKGPDVKVSGWQRKSFWEVIKTPEDILEAVATTAKEKAPGLLRRIVPGAGTRFPKGLNGRQLTKMVAVLLEQDGSVPPTQAASALVTERCSPLPQAVLSAIRRIEDDETDEEPMADAMTDTMSDDKLSLLHFCSDCESAKLELELEAGGADGRFTCRDCGTHMPVSPKCADCGEGATLTQQRRTFFMRCSACGVERVFYVNPAPEA